MPKREHGAGRGRRRRRGAGAVPAPLTQVQRSAPQNRRRSATSVLTHYARLTRHKTQRPHYFYPPAVANICRLPASSVARRDGCTSLSRHTFRTCTLHRATTPLAAVALCSVCPVSVQRPAGGVSCKCPAPGLVGGQQQGRAPVGDAETPCCIALIALLARQ